MSSFNVIFLLRLSKALTHTHRFCRWGNWGTRDLPKFTVWIGGGISLTPDLTQQMYMALHGAVLPEQIQIRLRDIFPWDHQEQGPSTLAGTVSGTEVFSSHAGVGEHKWVLDTSFLLLQRGLGCMKGGRVSETTFPPCLPGMPSFWMLGLSVTWTNCTEWRGLEGNIH